MGQVHSAAHSRLRSGGRRGSVPSSNDLAHAFSVRISMHHPQHGWMYLQYMRPNGKPVWGTHKCNYVSRINHFSSAQRLCREIFASPVFAPGTRVQFHKQFFRPDRTQRGTVVMRKISDKPIKDSTVIKP